MAPRQHGDLYLMSSLGRRGFTMIELLIALVILGIVSAALYKVLVTNQRTYLAQTQRIDLQRSEEHTSELQSLTNLVCRLLLEKKKMPEHIQQMLEHGAANLIHF